jgi:hypothetical protein
MENIIKLAISNSELVWNQSNREIKSDLEIPLAPSTFPSKAKYLCESGVDLVCSLTSKPSSG